MKIRTEQEKIKLTVPKPAPAQVAIATTSGAIEKTNPITATHVQKAAPSIFYFGSRIIDIILVAICGGMLGSSAILLFSLILPSGAINPVDIADLVLLTGISAFVIYLLCAICPIWLGLWMLLLQVMSGTYVGQVLVDSLCTWFLVDPQTLGPFQGVISVLFTFLFSVLPTFAFTLYTAAMESSPFKQTLGAKTSDLLVVDTKGRRLTFRHALRRELLYEFMPVLYASSVALGKNYRDRDSWLEQTSGTIKIKKPEKLEEEISKSKETVRVRYRAFQELESFLGHDKRNVPKVMRKVDVPFNRALHGVWALSVVTLCVLIPTYVRAPMEMLRAMFLYGQIQFSGFSDLLHLISRTLEYAPEVPLTLTSGVFLYCILVACRPTHVELTSAGVRFLSNAMPRFMQDKICPWNKISHIFLERVQGKASVADHRLVFELNDGKRLRLRLGSISSVAGKDEILKAVERWAPTTPRTAEVISALQPPSDFSYTELWMEALSAPPKREKLKPLIEGAVLREQQFTVERMLGVGGQGTAYLAEDAVSGQSVVLKEFVLPVYVDVGIRRKALGVFEKEARLLKELSHPNVVKLIDYFVEDHRAYLVLEHIDGLSLRVIVNRDGVFTEEKVRELTRQMSEILQYLHSQTPPVVHRDFTPDNLILRKDGTLKLIDFNVAQQTDSTAVSSVVGKTAYLPPEQFRGTPTTQSDIYALGGCMQFLLTGHDPIAIVSSDPRQARPDICDQLAEIVQKATAPELAYRYQTALEVAEALSNAMPEALSHAMPEALISPGPDMSDGADKIDGHETTT